MLLAIVFLVLSLHSGGLLSGLASSAQHGGRLVSAYTSRVVSVPVVNAVAHVLPAPVFLVLSLHTGVLLLFGGAGIRRHGLGANKRRHGLGYPPQRTASKHHTSRDRGK